MLFIFSTPVLIRHLWQLKTAAFLHRCLIHPVLLNKHHYNATVRAHWSYLWDRCWSSWRTPWFHQYFQCRWWHPSVNVIPLFSLFMILLQNKVECLPLDNFSKSNVCIEGHSLPKCHIPRVGSSLTLLFVIGSSWI